jgi:membrane protein implicated in regulation of membrane protease activity
LLYHFLEFTDLEEVARASQVAPRWEVTTGFARRRVPVVLLTDMADLTPAQARGLVPVLPGVQAPVSQLVRITVSVAGASYWRTWAEDSRVTRKSRHALERSGGNLLGRWWVVTHPIGTDEWVRVQELDGMHQLWPVTAPTPKHASPAREPHVRERSRSANRGATVPPIG